MRKCTAFLLLPLFAGCLVSRPLELSEWLVEYRPSTLTESKVKPADVIRLSQVVVLAPYDCQNIMVLRSDGTVAFDAYNRFAALPSNLLRGPALDALTASGRFDSVVASYSAASSNRLGELCVTRLALDCRENGRRAVVALNFRLLDADRNVVRLVTGSASIDAADGQYGAAFSRAFSKAISDALANI